jgi:hypothetical protein
MSAMSKSPAPPPVPPADGNANALRAQILATEHWSLLASRSTTQSEVLTRIAIFLTLVSATLVSLALVGQATRFGSVFPMFAIAILAFASVVGLLTQIRVINVSMEDLGYVIAMNRLRDAYSSLCPGVEDAFMTSTHDDQAGAFATYYFLGPRRNRSQILGSSMMFIIAVNGALVGLLAAAIVITAGASAVPAVIVGCVFVISYVLVSMVVGSRPFFTFWKRHVPRSPSV